MVCNGRALQNVQMYKLNMVLDVHPYAITAPSKNWWPLADICKGR